MDPSLRKKRGEMIYNIGQKKKKKGDKGFSCLKLLEKKNKQTNKLINIEKEEVKCILSSMKSKRDNYTINIDNYAMRSTRHKGTLIQMTHNVKFSSSKVMGSNRL